MEKRGIYDGNYVNKYKILTASPSVIEISYSICVDEVTLIMMMVVLIKSVSDESI